MGLSSKKTKTTVTPSVTEPMGGFLFSPDTGFAPKVSEFLEKDPTQFVAPASDLQNQAFAGAQNLGGWQPMLQQASNLASDFASRPATSVNLGGYQAPTLGSAATANAAQLGPVTNATSARLANPTMADWRSILDDGGIQKYMDPGLDAYVKNTLAGYDQNVAEQQAAMLGRAAGSGAFGGSRYGIAEGQFAADAARDRALTEGGLRSQAYTQGLGAAMSEAARRQGLDLTNAGTANQFALQQGGYDQQANMYNAGAANDFALQQGGFNQQANLANQAAQNQFQLSQFGADTDAARYGADQANQEALTNAQLQEQAYMRSLQSAGLLGDLAGQYGTQDRADLGLTADIGGIQRGIQSEYLNAYPTQLQMAGNLYGMINPNAYIGNISTAKQSGGALGQILGTAANIGSAIAFSDRRLKTDVEQIGKLGELGVYRFRYIGEDGTRVGVMADEVAIHAPEALGPVINGFATVDYAKLGV